jgi:hypothetical protein
MAAGQVVVFVGGGPAADFSAVLIDEPHCFRRHYFRNAIDHDLFRFWMPGAIKIPDSSVGEPAEVTRIWLGRPKGKPFEDFWLGSAGGPDIFDKAISKRRLHSHYLPSTPRINSREPGVKEEAI